MTVFHVSMSLLCCDLAMSMRCPFIIFCLDGLKCYDEPSGQWVGMPTFSNGFNVGKLWTIFTRCVANAMRSEDAFSFASERLERYESELNEYLSASSPMGCGTSSVGSAKYTDTHDTPT